MAAAAGARIDPAFALAFGALVGLAWAALWLWSGSPYGAYLDHGSWMRPGLVGDLCRTLPGGGAALHALLYGAGWLLMCVAMMLPTTAPVLAAWGRLTARRADRALLLALVVAGYLAAWAAFGLLAHAFDAALRALAPRSPWLAVNGWAVGAAALGLAGLFQFSALKHRCLDGCRSPLAFALDAWQRPRPRLQAWRLGLRHGAYCVGCCWALMLLMFVVGMASLGAMLLLAAAMAAEKNLPGGRRLAAPLGVLLLAAGACVAAMHLG